LLRDRQWLIIAVLKLGVAVRQGKPLFKTCSDFIRQQLKPYKPQKQYLSLIGTGDRAIASWGSLGFGPQLLWHWKDWIDRRFMERFIYQKC